MWVGRCGLRVGPGAKKANSVVTALPRTRAPATLRAVTAAASSPASASGGSRLPARVGKPPAWKMSLTATGTPKSGGRAAGSGWRTRSDSASWWRRSKRPGSGTKARISGSRAAKRAASSSSQAWRSTSPERSAAASGARAIGAGAISGGVEAVAATVSSSVRAPIPAPAVGRCADADRRAASGA